MKIILPEFKNIFSEYDHVIGEQTKKRNHRKKMRNALETFLMSSEDNEEKRASGFERMRTCTEALEAIDRQGWTRSFHQRLFHNNFIRACARIFWKTERPGQFAKDHQRILELNGWDSLSQEILVSTPRRLFFIFLNFLISQQVSWIW
jgi:hypothetical protein